MERMCDWRPTPNAQVEVVWLRDGTIVGACRYVTATGRWLQPYGDTGPGAEMVALWCATSDRIAAVRALAEGVILGDGLPLARWIPTAEEFAASRRRKAVLA